MISGENHELLDELERLEEPLLSWGVVDGGFSEEELAAIVERSIEHRDGFVDARDVIDGLERAGLLFRDAAASRSRWRTRSAETIRLIVRLRQLLGDRAYQPGSWRKAPTLVSDFRYRRRPRAYPRRDQPLEQLLDLLTGPDAARQHQVIEALATEPDGPLQLAGFQTRAVSRVLEDLQANQSRGVVVGAGTGSGKTLAFYLPALAHATGYIDGSSWTKVIAVYPRNELLKDQLADAFQQVRKLDELLIAQGRRKLRIGAFFGLTPFSAAALDQERGWNYWPREGRLPICPYLTCPRLTGNEICRGKLAWLEDDRRNRTERLTCLRCSREIDDEELVLTRHGMFDAPPDVLFTTTEMLNRSMSDIRAGRVFGVHTERPPHLMLLDEIHTYSGTTGAQTGMVLRRWQHHLRAAPVEFVGLSATLRGAARFFSELTGLEEDVVTYVEASPDELMYEGAEYLLALRSDPVSGASTLSTTIQTSMLLPRCLDSASNPVSGGLYGNRIFVFTDDLDVTNRLYYDLLDAEGQRLDSHGHPVANAGRASLATLRNPADDSSRSRRLAGQSWDLPLHLGHRLSRGERLTVSRTSSQDIGVDQQSQVIVATASLDVGFNDPSVGAVLQHKAPRDPAQFLQRKGRAGRTREMRPWTVVVLSDYGRDRDTYQAWDTLFEPELPPRHLAVRNRYVLRMHAAQAVIDWVAVRYRSQLGNAALWPLLSGPPSEGPYADQNAKHQRVVADALDELLTSSERQADLIRWLGSALRIDPEEAAELAWQSPRPVLLGAVPTLLRRLRSNWATAQPDGLIPGSDRHGANPFPEFASPNLFSDLELPEIQVLIPAQASWRTEEQQSMDATPAIRQYAPGRVSRRFATSNAYHRHWVPVPETTGSDELEYEISDAYPENALAATALIASPAGPVAINVIRPFNIRTQLVPDEITDSSNSDLNWATQFVEQGTPFVVGLPGGHGWEGLVGSLEFRLHARQSHVETRRFATGAEADIRFKDGTERRHTMRFVLQRDGIRESVGVGTVTDVDGIRVAVSLPDDVPQLDASREPEGNRALRSAWFRHRVLSDADLRRTCNVFQAGWLHDSLLALLTREAIDRHISLREALEEQAEDLTNGIAGVLDILFQRADWSHLSDDENGGDNAGGRPARGNRFQQRLRGLASRAEVIAALRRLAPILWEDLGEDCRAWIQQRGLATIGAALLTAARRLCPDHNPEDLLLDVEPGVDDSGHARTGEVWLTEVTIGGGGFLEALAQKVSADPRHFLRLTKSALSPGEAEIVDQELRRILDGLGPGSNLADAFDGYRKAARNDARQQALAELRTTLSGAGIRVTHSVVAAVVMRLLRPGTSVASDEVIRDLIERWRSEEQRLGIEIDPRTWSVFASADASLDGALSTVLPPDAGDTRQWRIDAISSILWPRGWGIRADALAEWNPYQELPPALPEWVRSFLGERETVVDVTDATARGTVRDLLLAEGAVVLAAPIGEPGVLTEVIADLIAVPIELEYLQVHPRVTGVSQRADWLNVSVELQEVL